jgi:hypothetical protein
MPFFRKKPVIIEAHRWLKNGDHPKDNATEMRYDTQSGVLQPVVVREGKIVRYYRYPERSGESACKHCGGRLHDHGWIDTLEGGHIVCPGAWIITGVKGEHYPCADEIFRATYEEVSYDTMVEHQEKVV